MKKLLFITCMISCSFIYAQEFPYTLTILTDSYDPLDEAISITPNNPAWDDPAGQQWTVPLGFSFNLMGQEASSIIILEPGSVIGMDVNADAINVFSAYNEDIRNADTVDVVSNILYTTEGQPGERIFKIEWNNVGFFTELDQTGELSSTISYEVWMYETSNIIEFRYGPNNIIDGDNVHPFLGAPLMLFLEGINLQTGNSEGSWTLQGDPTNPDVESFDVIFQNPTEEDLLMGEPANGVVYRFAPIDVAVGENDPATRFALYPSIADKHITTNWSGNSALVTIYDMQGNIVSTEQLQNGVQQHDISALASGAYVVKVNDGKNALSGRFIKK